MSADSSTKETGDENNLPAEILIHQQQDSGLNSDHANDENTTVVDIFSATSDRLPTENPQPHCDERIEVLDVENETNPESSSQPSQSSDGKEMEWILKSTEETVVSVGDPVTLSSLKTLALEKCSIKAWRRRFPISIWLPEYSLKDFSGDIIAGGTVGLCVVPLSLAYAAIADVPLEYGLNSAFIGCFMYTIFGTAKDVSLGPTSLLALTTASSMPIGVTLADRARYAVLFCFFGGLFQLILGFLNLGFLINYVSDPVISGFTTASATLVIYSQIRTIAGFRSSSSDNIIGISAGYDASKIKGWDVLVGMISLGWLLLCSQYCRLPRTPRYRISYRSWQILRKTMRVIAETRYVQVIVIATGVSYLLTINGRNVLSVTREVRGGVPLLKMPEFAWNNQTTMQSFLTVLPGIPMIILVGSLECIAVGKALALHFRYRIDSTQEFVALGAANMCCAFFHGMPVTGSFARSAFKAQLGVRTPMGSTWTGVCVLLTITLFSPALKYVPRATLSAMLIASILVLFDFKIFKDLWVCRKAELFPLVTTILVCCFVSLGIGILCGVATSFLVLFYPMARPHLKAVVTKTRYGLPVTSREKHSLHVDISTKGPVVFPGAENLSDFIQNVKLNQSEPKILPRQRQRMRESDQPFYTSEVVIDGGHLEDSDYSTLRAVQFAVIGCSKEPGTIIRFVNTPATELAIIFPEELRELSEWRQKYAYVRRGALRSTSENKSSGNAETTPELRIRAENDVLPEQGGIAGNVTASRVVKYDAPRT